MWEYYPKIQMLDLSQNPHLDEIGIPDEFSRLVHLKSLRLQQCGLTSLPVSILSAFDDLQSLDLEKNKFTVFYDDQNIT